MLLCTALRRGNVFHTAPAVYPFSKPFHDTPYDQDRHRLDVRNTQWAPKSWPVWMDKGADGAGTGIGLHRAHPLSHLQGNLRRGPRDLSRVLHMMIQGVWHKSGMKLYYRGGKPPNPSMHPYLTGEPCPVYGWKVTDESVIREFNVPYVEAERARYKPYVALQERKILDTPGAATTTPPPPAPSPSTGKPLMKRLFFWQ